MKTTIIIADDHKVFSESLAINLAQGEDFEILKIVSDGQELLEELNCRRSDIVLLDYNMPKINGLEAANVILKQYSDIKIIFLTMHSSMNIIAPLIKLGIKGIILKNTSTTDVITAMREVLMGRTYYSQEIIANITKSMNNSIQFTKREIEIIRLLKEALTTKEIAEKLFLSTHTVESHRKNILAKTQCSNRQALLNFIDNNNII